MSIVSEERPQGSPYVESITRGVTVANGSTIRPAEINWHMILRKLNGSVRLLVVGPWTRSGVVSWGEGAELLWIKLKLGTFMRHLPTPHSETVLPGAAGQTFWLNDTAWPYPDFEDADLFVDRLVRDGLLASDPLVSAVLQDERPVMPARTVRHRFLRATGLTHGHIRQMERARQARALLEQGFPILDVVEEAGYFDQPHLTRSLRQFIGYTPAQILRMSLPDCQSVQDSRPLMDYHASIPEGIR